MGEKWDKDVPSVDVWKECLRILKHGAFLFCMSSPRQDVLARNIIAHADAGFETGFTSLYWIYVGGMPKGANISKLADKRRAGNHFWEIREYLKDAIKKSGLTQEEIAEHLGRSSNSSFISHWTGNSQPQIPTGKDWQKLKEILPIGDKYDDKIIEVNREIIGQYATNDPLNWYANQDTEPRKEMIDITVPSTPQAKAFDGSFAGYQPKPALEIILVAMKPLEYPTYINQALDNGKGITWLGDCRIPHGITDNPEKELKNPHMPEAIFGPEHAVFTKEYYGLQAPNPGGYFPSNVIVTDDALNDGVLRQGKGNYITQQYRTVGSSCYQYSRQKGHVPAQRKFISQTGSFSKHFDLDAWWEKRLKELSPRVRKTFPYLITSKAPQGERFRYCKVCEEVLPNDEREKHRSHGLHCLDCGVDISMTAYKAEHKEHKVQSNLIGHAAQKPLKLFSYLTVLGSREGDIILDPFAGTCTTAVAAKSLNRNFIMIDIDPVWAEIGRARVDMVQELLF